MSTHEIVILVIGVFIFIFAKSICELIYAKKQ